MVAQQKQIQLVAMRRRVPSLASISGLGIWRCCELWCGSRTYLESHVAVTVAVAVVVAGSCSSDSTPSLGISMLWEQPKTPAAYESYQVRGLIRAVAASLHHISRSEPRLRPTPQLTAKLDP